MEEYKGDKRKKEYKQWQNIQEHQEKKKNVNPEKREQRNVNLNEGNTEVIIQDGGLGTTIKEVLEIPVIKPIVETVKKLIWKDGKDCGCNKREETINRILPYRFKAKCLTEEEHKAWTHFKDVRTLKINNEQILLITQLYARVFNRYPVYVPCRNCSPSVLIHMIDKLDKVYSVYETNK